MVGCRGAAPAVPSGGGAAAPVPEVQKAVEGRTVMPDVPEAQKKHGGILRVSMGSKQANFDPHSTPEMGLPQTMFQQWLETDPMTGSFGPGIIEKWDAAADGMSYTLY